MTADCRIAILDDYQHAAPISADWSRLDGGVSLDFIDQPLAGLPLDEQAAVLADYDGLVAMRERMPFPAALLHRLPRLRLLVTTGPRNRAIDLAACASAGVTVCATRSDPLLAAEQAWTLLMALAKDVVGNDAHLRAGRWQTGLGRSLRGATLGLIGLGRLGAQMAHFAHAFGLSPIAWSPNLTDERCAPHRVQRVSFDTLIETADVVSLHLVPSPATIGLLSEPQLRRMKADALLVSTSRGELLDEAALVRVLQSGHLAGAALDVFATEPLPVDSPLRSAPRTLLSPHVGYVSRENYRTYYSDAVEDIIAWRAGNPVRRLA